MVCVWQERLVNLRQPGSILGQQCVIDQAGALVEHATFGAQQCDRQSGEAEGDLPGLRIEPLNRRRFRCGQSGAHAVAEPSHPCSTSTAWSPSPTAVEVVMCDYRSLSVKIALRVVEGATISA
jgi:hypothetical protein